LPALYNDLQHLDQRGYPGSHIHFCKLTTDHWDIYHGNTWIIILGSLGFEKYPQEVYGLTDEMRMHQ